MDRLENPVAAPPPVVSAVANHHVAPVTIAPVPAPVAMTRPMVPPSAASSALAPALWPGPGNGLEGVLSNGGGGGGGGGASMDALSPAVSSFFAQLGVGRTLPMEMDPVAVTPPASGGAGAVGAASDAMDCHGNESADVLIPCEICMRDVPFEAYAEHTEACARRAAARPGAAPAPSVAAALPPPPPPPVYAPAAPVVLGAGQGAAAVGSMMPMEEHDDVVLMAPCEFCQRLFEFEQLDTHQRRCQRKP